MVGSNSSSEGVGVESLMKAPFSAESLDETEITDFAGEGLRGERAGIVGGGGAVVTVEGGVKGVSYVDLGLAIPTRRERGWT
jgi:hypothetical protein